MTAQIAIMNKNAVAIATDSAVTTRDARGVKVHNSANKLFTLSKYHPVGIMVHANAEFMDYPWETLIKVYRDWLGKRSFPTVTDYADSFFEFLGGQGTLFTPEKQERWFQAQAHRLLSLFNQGFTEEVRQHIDQNGPIDGQTVEGLFAELLERTESLVYSSGLLDLYTHPDTQDAFVTSATPLLESTIAEVFQALPIEAYRDRLFRLFSHRFMSSSALDYSGIVFAGFGETEMLPVVESYWVDAVFAAQLRRLKHSNQSKNLNEAPGAWIIPFAQSDTVLRFLRGIDPTYKRDSLNHIDTLINAIKRHSAESTAPLHPTAEARHEAAGALDSFATAQRDQLHQQLEAIENERFLGPVMGVIDSLPKDDLAAIAESLVNLTSFQRKILREVESVGGPIDVAVISKGDGFIWIKRKHYFDRDLNPGFFANYFGG